MSKSRKLDQFKGESASGSPDVYLENGSLQVLGVIWGDYIENTMGDWDHEFWFQVEPGKMRQVYAALDVSFGDEDALLDAIVNRFGKYEDKAYKTIMNFLREKGIEFEQWQWT